MREDPCEVCVEQNRGVDVDQNTPVVVRRRALTTARRLVTETRGAIAKEVRAVSSEKAARLLAAQVGKSSREWPERDRRYRKSKLLSIERG